MHSPSRTTGRLRWYTLTHPLNDEIIWWEAPQVRSGRDRLVVIR